MSSWIFAIVQFLPLSLFMGYALIHGLPTDDRWLEAFQIGAAAALVQLLVVLPQRRPTNRLILAVNLYLLLGGLAAISHQYWFLRFYGMLMESGVFLLMFGVGAVSTFATSAGFVAVVGIPQKLVRRASLLLLATTALALGASLFFQGNRVWAGVVPMVCIAALQRVLVYRLNSVKKKSTYPSVAPDRLRAR